VSQSLTSNHSVDNCLETTSEICALEGRLANQHIFLADADVQHPDLVTLLHLTK